MSNEVKPGIPARQAIDQVKNLARTFRSVIDLADYLEGIESVEQAARDAETRKAAAFKAAELAQEDLKALGGKIAQAEKALAQKEAQAQQIEANLRAKATGIVEAAKEEAKAKLDEARGHLEAKRAELEKERQALAEAKVAVSAKQAELVQVETKIAALKKQAQDLLR